MKTRVLLALAGIFLALQFFRPVRNDTAPALAGQDDITALYPPPPEVRQILATSCYDCHSNHTNYPWYAEVQPVGWWLARHVADGRRELNFSEFGAYSVKRQRKKLEAIQDEVGDHTMPLRSYTFIHRQARLSPAQASALTRWAGDAADRLPED